MPVGIRALYAGVDWKLLRLSPPHEFIQYLCERLPPAAVSEGCLEWHMATAADQLDLWAVIPHSPAARANVREYVSSARPASSLQWQQFYRFLELWSEDDTPLSRQVGDLFVEFDATHGGQPEPIVVASLMTGKSAGTVRSVHTYVQQLTGDALEAPLQLELLRVVEQTPASGHLRNVAVMQRNGQVLVRLVVYVNALSLPDYLQGVGLPALPSQLDPLIAALQAQVSLVGIQVDLGDTSRVAMEVLMPPVRGSGTLVQDMLNWLVSQGLCDADKATRVTGWFSSAGPDQRLIVKLRWDRQRCYEVKCYLMVTPAQAQRQSIPVT